VRSALLIWCGLTAVGIVISVMSVLPLFALYKSGATTLLTSSAVDPSNSRVLRYTYELDGTSYNGTYLRRSEAGVDLEPRPDAPRTVYYLPENPSVSTIGNPGRLLVDEVGRSLATTLVGSTVITFGVMAVITARRKRLPASYEPPPVGPPAVIRPT
jgi:hypothetical protein